VSSNICVVYGAASSDAVESDDPAADADDVAADADADALLCFLFAIVLYSYNI